MISAEPHQIQSSINNSVIAACDQKYSQATLGEAKATFLFLFQYFFFEIHMMDSVNFMIHFPDLHAFLKVFQLATANNYIVYNRL